MLQMVLALPSEAFSYIQRSSDAEALLSELANEHGYCHITYADMTSSLVMSRMASISRKLFSLNLTPSLYPFKYPISDLHHVFSNVRAFG